MTRSIYKPRCAAAISHHRIRGVDHRCSRWGGEEGPLLVMLHGWGDTGSAFQFVVDELESDWRVIAPDWRGFGDSAHSGPAYWFPDYLADLDALLEIVSPSEPVHLVGHSMGANVAGLYAGIFPERVRTFTNIEGFGLPDSDPGNAPDTYRRWIEQGRSSPPPAEYDDFEQLVPRILKRSPRMGSDKALFIARQWARRGEDDRVRLRADPAHKQPNAVQYRRAEAVACWSRVQAPVLLVAGAETEFTAAKDWFDADSNDLPFPNASAVAIPGAGHRVHFEQPRALAAAIEAFLAPHL